jgi:hypothetical protein
MDTIKQDVDKLEFISSLSPIVRIVFLLFGFIPLLAPYELLIKPSWNGKFSIGMIFFLIISIGAISISIYFISAALFGRSQRFQFDGANRVVRYRFKSIINPLREERYDFSQIEVLKIKVNEWDSRSDSYDISMKIRGKPEMKFGDFQSRQEAEYYLTALEKIRHGGKVSKKGTSQ